VQAGGARQAQGRGSKPGALLPCIFSSLQMATRALIHLLVQEQGQQCMYLLLLAPRSLANVTCPKFPASLSNDCRDPSEAGA
jgi:hypothetical protein